jgi:hypothetical protein
LELPKKVEILKLLVPFLLLVISGAAYSDHHEPVPVGDGAFVTLMVQAENIEAYVASLKNNDAPFKAIGAVVAGVCVTKTGNDYPGQMFVWSGFDSIVDAVASTDKYDAFQASAELMALRQVKYSAIFKPLKEYTLEPGFERLWRLKISNENITSYVAQIAKLEKALRANGHSINLGVFRPIGGGKHEAYHLRAASPTSAASGRILAEAFAGAAWMSIWTEASALVEEVISDNFEECEIVYSAK